MSVGITPTNNEIKDIVKVIRSLENRGILLKEILEKLIAKKEDFLTFLNHYVSWFTINEKYTYIIN